MMSLDLPGPDLWPANGPMVDGARAFRFPTRTASIRHASDERLNGPPASLGAGFGWLLRHRSGWAWRRPNTSHHLRLPNGGQPFRKLDLTTPRRLRGPGNPPRPFPDQPAKRWSMDNSRSRDPSGPSLRPWPPLCLDGHDASQSIRWLCRPCPARPRRFRPGGACGRRDHHRFSATSTEGCDATGQIELHR